MNLEQLVKGVPIRYIMTEEEIDATDRFEDLVDECDTAQDLIDNVHEGTDLLKQIPTTAELERRADNVKGGE